jgi:hypothetical protein
MAGEVYIVDAAAPSTIGVGQGIAMVVETS